MGRPNMPLGTHGSIRYYNDRPGLWRARTLFRDYDGHTREVQRKGRTKGEADRKLAEALRDRVYVGGEGIRADSRVSVAAEAWFTDLQTEGRALRTLEQYRYALDRTVLPAIGELRIRELSVATCARFLRAVEAKHGPATARMSRSVLSGICGYAARLDVLDRNPVRDAGTISSKPKSSPKALTAEQVRDLRIWLTYDDKAVARDLPDFVGFMLATGLRIGEAAAIQWRHVDLDTGTVQVAGSVMRLKGQGLSIQQDEGSKLTVRTLVLPSWCVNMLQQRDASWITSALSNSEPQELDKPIFPAPMGGLRDPSNTQADLREAFASCGYDWVTSHVFRKTVATLMDEAGTSARAVADQLGHAQPSMSQNKYMSRRRATGAADILEAIAI